jgi:hypothetical protein
MRGSLWMIRGRILSSGLRRVSVVAGSQVDTARDPDQIGAHSYVRLNESKQLYSYFAA